MIFYVDFFIGEDTTEAQSARRNTE